MYGAASATASGKLPPLMPRPSVTAGKSPPDSYSPAHACIVTRAPSFSAASLWVPGGQMPQSVRHV